MVKDDLWVIIACTSRYWFNYRHFGNGFLVYDIVKKLGVRDDQIVFMDAANVLHDPHNNHRGNVYLDHSIDKNVDNLLLSSTFSSIVTKDDANVNVHETIEIDYRGHEVNIQTFRDILLNQNPKVKFTNNSRILLYMTGHGGQEFLKFHDYEELTAQHFSSILRQMTDQQLFSKMLVVLDTCQAATLLGKYINELPNVIFASSSLLNQNSYGYFTHPNLGVVTYDRFTYALYQFFQYNYFPWRKKFHEFSATQTQNQNKTLLVEKQKKQSHHPSSKIRDASISEVMLSLPQDFLYSTVSIQEQTPMVHTLSVLYFFSSTDFQSFVATYNNQNAAANNPAAKKKPAVLAVDMQHFEVHSTEKDIVKSPLVLPIRQSNNSNPSSLMSSFAQQFVTRNYSSHLLFQQTNTALTHEMTMCIKPDFLCIMLLVMLLLLQLLV